MRKGSTCNICGEYFLYKSGSSSGKYCSWNCYSKLNRDSNNNPNYKGGGIKVCTQCGKEFKSYQKRKYCSQFCNYDSKRIDVKCINCEEIFKVPNAKRSRVFCSKKCQHEHNSKTNTVKKLCEECEKEYTVCKARHKSRYCSMVCVAKARKHFFKGELNPRWLGGVSGYRGEDWGVQRNKAIKRDKYTCQICGDQLAKLDIHHITPYRISKSNELKNLICLCSKCHPVEDAYYRKHTQPSKAVKNIVENIRKVTHN
jgi:hypothetical protein